MPPLRSLLFAALLALPASAVAQDKPAPARDPNAADRPQARPSRRSFADLPDPHPSILRHKSWHEEFVPSSQREYAYRNPGGVGRRAEYYPPNNQFQNDSPRHITAKIGNGGQPDRAEQLQAQLVGGANYNYLQTHIDRYGRPAFGFGMGFGW